MAAPITPQPAPIAAPPLAAASAPWALPRLIVAGVALLGGLLLIALAIPRFGTALELARAKPVYDAGESRRKHRRRHPGDGDRRAAQGLRAVVGAPARQHARLSLQGTGRSHDRRGVVIPRYAQAAEAARATLRISPSNLTAWAPLAASLDALNPKDPAVIAALTRAIRVGPYDLRLRDLRIMLAMRHWRRLDPETRTLAAFLIKRAAQLDLRALAFRPANTSAYRPSMKRYRTIRRCAPVSTRCISRFPAKARASIST